MKKTAVLRSGNSACFKLLVPIKAFRFSDMHYETERCRSTTYGLSIKTNKKRLEDWEALASRFRMPVDELGKLLHSDRTCITREIKRMRENKGFVSRNS